MNLQKKYKPAEKKTRAVPTTLPEEFCMVRKIPEDPLHTLPEMSKNPKAAFLALTLISFFLLLGVYASP